MDQQPVSGVRLLIIVVFMACTAMFLYTRNGAETIPVRQVFASLPSALGEWHGKELPIDQQVKDVLGAGDFTQRIYRREMSEPPVDLFMAYFPSQRTGNTMHSPKNCLPGSGWDPVETHQIEIPYKGSQASVNLYVVARGAERQMALYWYQAHDRIVDSEYTAKLCLVADAIRMNRTDGALVRIMTPIGNETNMAAQTRAEAFARQVMPMLDAYIPK
jgi:EpsI family protein